MKYLELFEAFRSKGISNTIKFLKSKIGLKNTNIFLDSLKIILEKSDYPISELSDSNIKYMNAKSALKLKNDKNVTNEKGLWVIKYWFSLDKGFLGYTGTGNKVYDYIEKNKNKKVQESFRPREIEYIKENITRTGEYYPVTDYSLLKTGDKILIFLSDRTNRYLTMATVFKEIDNNFYAIQDVRSGSSSLTNDWREYGRYTWFIYDPIGGIANDHYCLHLFKNTDEELHEVPPPEIEKHEDEFENPLKWNLPINSNLSMERWRDASSMYSDNMKNIDFAIVLYYDDLINPEADADSFETVSDKRKERIKDKKGALALMTDDSIKKENLERYISKLSNNLDISVDDIKNLQKIAIKSLSSEYSFYNLYSGSEISILSSICTYLYDTIGYIKNGNISQAESNIKRIKSYYEDLNARYYRNIQRYIETKSAVKGTKYQEIFNKIYKIGLEVSNYVRNQKLDTIDDLLILHHKMTSIRNFIFTDINLLSYSVRCLLNECGDIRNFNYCLSTYSEYGEFEKDSERLERINKYIKQSLN